MKEKELKTYALMNEEKLAILKGTYDASVNIQHIPTRKDTIKTKSDNSLLGKLFKLVWETTNNIGLPFEVLTNIDLYHKSIIDSDFISSFVKALQNNVIIVPIKVVNVNDLNVSTWNHNGHGIDNAIRTEFGFRMFVSIFLPSLDSDQTNMYYDKDHIYLELNQTNQLYKNARKEILDSFKEISIKEEQTSNVLSTLTKSNPEYHKLIYERNKANISIAILKEKLKTLNNNIYKLESGVLSEDLLESNSDNFKREYSNLFKKLLKDNSSKKSKEDKRGFKSVVLNDLDTTKISITDYFNDYFNKPIITSTPQPDTFLDAPFYEDYIDYDNGVYFDFNGDAYEIENLDLEKLNDLLERDLMSIESSDSIIVFRGL